MSAPGLAQRLLAWYRRHGRKELPWKQANDPYQIWVSEIMLQQTQVATVVPYFERFTTRFPHIRDLARADIDQVLHLWTGLGYYARARNLHKAANLIMDRHGGKFPRNFEVVRALPGIGPSTAAAIVAFAFAQRAVVLDGNVKRVLARYHAINGWPGRREVERQLWALAEEHTPRSRVREYTQAIMDLGATVCRRANPDCAHCPLSDTWAAQACGDPLAYPGAAPRRHRPVRVVAMLMIRDGRGRVLLQRRPPAGVWGGLWGFPECAVDEAPAWCRDALGLRVELDCPWPPRRHTFSHFHLDITPITGRVVGASDKLMEPAGASWYNLDRPDARGFAAPIKRLLEQLKEKS